MLAQIKKIQKLGYWNQIEFESVATKSVFGQMSV